VEFGMISAADEMNEQNPNEAHPNERELDEASEDAEHGAEETDVSGAPQTGTESDELEPVENPDEDAAGE
jgi:hypothetical protein